MYKMKSNRLYIVFACVTALHILVIVAVSFFFNHKPSPTADSEQYIELTDFQYSGSPAGGGGGGAPLQLPAQPSDPASTPRNEIVDAALPADPDALPADSAPSEASSSVSGVVGAGGMPGGTGDGTGFGYGGDGSGSGYGDNPDYVPMQSISQLPVIPEKFLRAKLEYPEMARRSGIMGRVFLELFIDSKGRIRKVEILKEDPPGYGFASAAVSALDGCTCLPAKMNGEAVAVRYRYPIRFSIN
jgi:protein TonB